MTDPARDPVKELVEIVGRINPRLADTNRARGAVALVERIQREAAGAVVEAGGGGKTGTALRWALVGVLASAAGVLLWLSLHNPASVRIAPAHAPSMPSGPSVSSVSSVSTLEKSAPTVAPSRPSPGADLAILRILSPHGRPTVPGRVRLEGRAGEDVQAALADAGRLTLRGAGQVVVEESSPAAIVLGLDRGTLLVSFDHESGRSLAVRTADALVRVTGTVFAVQAGDGPTQVSVSRGSVEVEASGLPVSVTAGRSWQVGAKRLSALDAEVGQALRELRVSAGPSRGGVVAPPPIEVAAPEGLRAQTGASGGSWSAPRPEATLPAPRGDRVLAPPVASGADGADAETLYRAAERAMLAGDNDSAKAGLRGLIDKYPDHPLATPAAYDLGRLAFAARAFDLARAQFAPLRESSSPEARRFREPAAYFDCRSEQEQGRGAEAIRCLERYRAEFPGSPHDSETLAELALLYVARLDCGSALPLIEEYLKRFPSGAHARAMQPARERCQRSSLGIGAGPGAVRRR